MQLINQLKYMEMIYGNYVWKFHLEIVFFVGPAGAMPGLPLRWAIRDTVPVLPEDETQLDSWGGILHST